MNRSSYRTSDLRRFLGAAVRAYHGPRTLSVTVTEHPRRTRGCATLGGRTLVLSLGPNAAHEPGKVALILRHELQHLSGVEHEDMPEDILFSEGPCPSWAARLPLRQTRMR